jgi:hypothetical protein
MVFIVLWFGFWRFRRFDLNVDGHRSLMMREVTLVISATSTPGPPRKTGSPRQIAFEENFFEKSLPQAVPKKTQVDLKGFRGAAGHQSNFCQSQTIHIIELENLSF